MKRKIINIDEEKCTGCGLCIPNCPEGALQIIDGKARLVGELLCDGLGACVGKCPQGAMTVEEKEAQDYDETKVMANLVKAGESVISAHLKHLKDHHQDDYLKQAEEYLKKHNIAIPKVKKEDLPCGCPGIMTQDLRNQKQEVQEDSVILGKSQLGQWPIQLQLLNPNAAYFKDADLVIAADCTPFAYSNFHQRFLKGKILIILCPKLDKVRDFYVEKLAQIFSQNNIKSIIVVHMQVPCCFGLVSLVEESLKKSGKNIIIKDYTISIKGEII